MKTITNQGRQGDVLIMRIDSLPDDARKATSQNGQYIVAHSEAGHNHIVEAAQATLYEAANDPLTAYLVVDHQAELKHLRGFNTHESHSLKAGVYRIRRQRQQGIEGWERVAD